MPDPLSYKVFPSTLFVAGQTLTVWTPGPGKRLRLRALLASADIATVVRIRLAGDLIATFDWTNSNALGPFELTFPEPGLEADVGAALTVTSSAAVSVGVTAFGREI